MTQEYTYLNATSASQEPLSVSQALGVAKQALEGITLSIVGEISDLSNNSRYKAIYFTLADESSALPCLMWRSVFDHLGLQLKSGMRLEVRGRFSLYSAKGRMQFDVRQLTLAGEGQLRAQVAALAARLSAQGFMDEARKLPLPKLAETIALVTSPRGKAVHDVLRTLRRRFPLARVLLFGVGVEGKHAAADMIQALQAAEQSAAEVILLVRGGGSYEDLMPFNDERLALAIAKAAKPVITGIGHEPDTSIADMVASLRASTPTAAAEAATPNKLELEAQLTAEQAALASSVARCLERSAYALERAERSAVFINPRFLTGERVLALEQATLRLGAAIPTGLKAAQAFAKDLQQRLQGRGSTLIAERAGRTEHACQSFLQVGRTATAAHAGALQAAAASLESLSPLKVLSRGYALGYDEQGRLLRSVGQVTQDDVLRIQLADGSIQVRAL